MHALKLLVPMVMSYVFFKIGQCVLVSVITAKRWFGLDFIAEDLRYRADFQYWRFTLELDGVYTFHVDQARDGVLELYWRHHSSMETPAEVFSSLRSVVTAALPQIEQYLSFSDARCEG